MQVPQAVNYPSPLQAIPSKLFKTPAEGNQSIPCEIDWGTMGGASQAVQFNFQNNNTLDFSQMVSIKVDNSQCGSDVTFIFQDTTDTLTVPAYFPAAIFPVFTNRRDFICVALGEVIASDTTRFNVLNFLPPPVTMPTTQEQNNVSFNNVDATVAGNTQLIPATQSGTIENLHVFAQLNQTNGTCIFDLVDGLGKVIGGSQVASTGSFNVNVEALGIDGAHLRFVNGLQLQISFTNVPANSKLAINVLYRTP